MYVYSHKKNLTFAQFLVDFLAMKLIATCNIRHLNNECLNVIGIGSIKILIQAHIFAHFLVNFLAMKLIATCNMIGIGSIKNLNTGSYFCTFFGEFSSNKVDSTM